jgi:hypothetical protein
VRCAQITDGLVVAPMKRRIADLQLARLAARVLE